MQSRPSRWDAQEREESLQSSRRSEDEVHDTGRKRIRGDALEEGSSSRGREDLGRERKEAPRQHSSSEKQRMPAGLEPSKETPTAPTHSPTKPRQPYNPLFYGCRSVENYQRLSFIDQGTYGLVFKAKCRETGEVVALKQVKLGQLTSKVGFPVTALRETNILLFLHHPNIVAVKEMVVGSSTDKIFMVMEYCGHDLRACIQQSRQSFSIAEIKQLLIQLCSALEYMHENWIIHRDLKTSNLLYTNGKLSICDFGMARKYSDPILPYTKEVITLWYRPPEILLGAPTYSTPVDIWSAGCIMGELISGKPLFPGEGELDQISKIFTVLGAPSEAIWPGCSSLPHLNKISYRVPSRCESLLCW